MAVDSIVAASGCTGCKRMEAEQRELDEVDEDRASSTDESTSPDLGMSDLSRLFHLQSIEARSPWNTISRYDRASK